MESASVALGRARTSNTIPKASRRRRELYQASVHSEIADAVGDRSADLLPQVAWVRDRP